MQWRRLGALSLVLGLSAFSLGAFSVSAVFADSPEIELQTQIGFASALERGGELQKNELLIEPRFDVRFSATTRLTGKVLLRADFADNLEPGQPSNDVRSLVSSRMMLGDYVDVELRELFVDFELGAAQVRLGKQQVVWGQADGLRILDVINPLSYREFILPDFEDRRIPLWMLNVETPVGETILQVLWIFDQTYDEFPASMSTYAPTAPRFQPALEDQELAQLNSVHKPNNPLKDSDVGLRLSAFAGGWDLTANYLYHFQDQAILELDRSFSVTRVTPTYERTHLLGFTATNAFGDFVVRGEIGFSSDRYFTSTASLDGVEKSGELAGVLGLDYSGITDTLVSAQFFQSSVRSSSGMLRKQHERSVTLLLRRNFSNDTLTAQLLAIHNTSDSDGLVQLELSYQLTSNLTLAMGADVFYGAGDGVFGQYSARDRFTSSFELAL